MLVVVFIFGVQTDARDPSLVSMVVRSTDVNIKFSNAIIRHASSTSDVSSFTRG